MYHAMNLIYIYFWYTFWTGNCYIRFTHLFYFPEQMRKYPALAFITRICVKEYKIPGTDIIVDKDTEVFVPIKGIHHDTEYYEEPDKFDPSRFEPENIQARHPYTHIPFGEGPRTCIGEYIMNSIIGIRFHIRKLSSKALFFHRLCLVIFKDNKYRV